MLARNVAVVGLFGGGGSSVERTYLSWGAGDAEQASCWIVRRKKPRRPHKKASSISPPGRRMHALWATTLYARQTASSGPVLVSKHAIVEEG